MGTQNKIRVDDEKKVEWAVNCFKPDKAGGGRDHAHRAQIVTEHNSTMASTNFSKVSASRVCVWKYA